MLRAYSDDLRWRIVWQHYFLDVAAERVAEIMQVHRTFSVDGSRPKIAPEKWSTTHLIGL